MEFDLPLSPEAAPAQEPYLAPPAPRQPRTLRPLDSSLWLGLVMIAVAHILIWQLRGIAPMSSSPYNSYTLQAWAWRHGSIALSGDFPWLELAIYRGEFYVSFPPVPALAMLPLTYFFPEAETPDYLISLLYALGSYALLYRCAKSRGASANAAMFWGLFACLGSNLCAISSDGGVWYLAQGLSFLLSCAALERALCGRSMGARMASTAFLALAVGCRPFQIVFFPFLFLVFWMQDGDGDRARPASERLLRLAATCMLPAVIGAAYALYNHVRFADPFEFGHNYLPEFAAAEHGQFDPMYVRANVETFLFGMPAMQADNALGSLFGFSLLLANPLYVVGIANVVIDRGTRRADIRATTGGLCVLLCLVLLFLHKSFGGFQFGARYTTDALPFLLGTIWLRRGDDRLAPREHERWIGWLAIAWNLYGTILLGSA